MAPNSPCQLQRCLQESSCMVTLWRPCGACNLLLAAAQRLSTTSEQVPLFSSATSSTQHCALLHGTAIHRLSRHCCMLGLEWTAQTSKSGQHSSLLPCQGHWGPLITRARNAQPSWAVSKLNRPHAAAPGAGEPPSCANKSLGRSR